MRIVWSLPVRGARLEGSRGDLVRARALVGELRRLGHEVEVIEDAARAGAQAAVAAWRGPLGRALGQRPGRALRDLGRVWHGRGQGRAVAAAVRARDADAIVETQVAFAASGWLAARATGRPLLLDDCSPAREERALGAGLPGLARLVLRAAARRSVAVVAVTEAMREMLIGEGVPADRIRIVPNGVDLAAYARADRERARAELGLAPGEVAIGFVGSFQPWHRVELLVEAFAALGEPCPLRLVLVGEGPGRLAVLERARALGVLARVSAPGAVPPDAVASRVAALDIGVLPASNDYGHPMKLVEYAAAGVVPVAPDLAPVREVVRDGENGVLFPPGGAGPLTRALARLLADPALRVRIGQAARRDIAAPAAWSERARSLAALLAAAVAEGRR